MILQYPPQIKDNNFMMFSPKIPANTKENVPSNDGSGKKTKTKQQSTHDTKEVIYMYHPEMLQTSASIEWADNDMGILGNVSSVAKMMANPGSITVDDAKSVGMNFLGGAAKDLGNRDRGAVENPQKGMFFRGIGFREFQFTFMFSPESLQEAQAAQNIILMFKKYSHPTISKNKIDLIYPPRWQIESSLETATGAKTLVQYKDSVITGIDVDFAPNQIMSTFGDGHPVNIKMDIKFKEAEIITSADFAKPLGYGF